MPASHIVSRVSGVRSWWHFMYYCAFVLVLGVTGVVLIVLDLSLTWGSGVWLSMTYESDICRLHIFCGWSGNSRQKRETKFGKKEQKLLCHNPLIGNLMHRVWMILISMQLMGLGWRWSTTSWMVAFIFSFSYYHHQIGSMSYYPLFRTSSSNKGTRCMSIYSYCLDFMLLNKLTIRPQFLWSNVGLFLFIRWNTSNEPICHHSLATNYVTVFENMDTATARHLYPVFSWESRWSFLCGLMPEMHE